MLPVILTNTQGRNLPVDHSRCGGTQGAHQDSVGFCYGKRAEVGFRMAITGGWYEVYFAIVRSFMVTLFLRPLRLHHWQFRSIPVSHDLLGQKDWGVYLGYPPFTSIYSSLCQIFRATGRCFDAAVWK